MTDTAASERADLVPADEAYAPQIQVLLNGQDVTDNLVDDVIDLEITLQRDELGGFSMQLANHFEWSLDGDKPTDGKYRHSDDERIDIFMPVTLSMGYVDRLKELFVGEITMLQPNFPSSDRPTFRVIGTDILNRLRRSKPSGNTTKSFENKADWEIAKIVAQRHGLPYSDKSVNTGDKNTFLSQKNMDDLTFLLYLAKRNDYEAQVIIEDNKPKLLFGVPTDKRDGKKVKQYGLRYGQSLISFTPSLRIASQVSSVTVRGWNSRTKKKFEYKATSKDLPKTGGKGKTGPERIEKQLTSKEDIVVDRPVQSQQEAKNLAIQMLTETANQYLKGSGEAMGDPRILPGVNLELTGLGSRFDGVYYVTKTAHKYGAGGYTTSFDVERLTDNFTGELKRV
jgi:phage protein D